MTRFLRDVFLAVALVAALATLGTLRADSGNGGFSYSLFPGSIGKQAAMQFSVGCSQGFTCGLTSIEVDWDDGSATDSVVGYVSQTQLLEEEFLHEYAQNGLYHAKFGIDDDLGNWVIGERDFNILD
jgi:hypothetical protein